MVLGDDAKLASLEAYPSTFEEAAALLPDQFAAIARQIPLARNQLASPLGRELRQRRWQAKQAALASALTGSGIDPTSPAGERLAAITDVLTSSTAVLELHDKAGIPIDVAADHVLWALERARRAPPRSSHDRPHRHVRAARQGRVAVAARPLPARAHPRVRATSCPTAMNAGEATRHGGVRPSRALPGRGAVAGPRLHRAGAAPRQAQRRACPRRPRCGPPTRLVPAFRRRTRAAARCLAERPWLADARRWYATEQSTWVAANRALQAEAPDAMDAPALVDHLRRAAGPRGGGLRAPLLAARSRPDADRPAPRPRRRLGHRTRAACSRCSPARRRPRRVAARPSRRCAVRWPRSGREPSTHRGAPRRSPAPELDAFLDEHGWRLVTGYDIDSLALIELPVAGRQPGAIDPERTHRRGRGGGRPRGAGRQGRRGQPRRARSVGG